jgi:hypothetical protein
MKLDCMMTAIAMTLSCLVIGSADAEVRSTVTVTISSSDLSKDYRAGRNQLYTFSDGVTAWADLVADETGALEVRSMGATDASGVDREFSPAPPSAEGSDVMNCPAGQAPFCVEDEELQMSICSCASVGFGVVRARGGGHQSQT